MNRNVIITCAVTGSGDTVDKHPAIPVTPAQIADAAIESAKAGATIAHCHVRDPNTGKPSRNVELYREVVDRIRSSDVDVVINLTSGMGGDVEIGGGERPLDFGPATDLVGPIERLAHVEALLPEICSLDCGSLNFGNGNALYVSTPEMLRTGVNKIRELGVVPELEIFDTGNLWFALQMLSEGLVNDPPFFQLCHGIPWGCPADPSHLMAMVNTLPTNAVWTAFALGAMQMPFVAQSVMLGGNVRVGLEDNLYLEKGVYASNPQLVERARKIVEMMGARVISPSEAREMLNLKKH